MEAVTSPEKLIDVSKMLEPLKGDNDHLDRALKKYDDGGAPKLPRLKNVTHSFEMWTPLLKNQR